MEMIFGWLRLIQEIPMGRHQTNYTTNYKTYTPKIKSTMEHSSKELLFLEIFIKNLNGQIITDIYHKPIDTQQYLNFISHHPKTV